MNRDAGDFARELYPFLYADAQTRAGDPDRLLAQVRDSSLQKARQVIELRDAVLSEFAEQMADAAAHMARCFAGGGKLLALGNGGSATDAQDAVADCLIPPVSAWRPLRAISLVSEPAVLTAIANDVGFEHVFARQIEMLGRAGDVAIGFTTSGNSPSVLHAFAEAKRRRLVTIGLAGYDGGALVRAHTCDFCFIVRGEYIPRIQEVQATIWHGLLELAQFRLMRQESEVACVT